MFRRFFRALGPALIVASVVLGPGSIVTSSKVGAAYGFKMFWVVLLAGGLMTGMVAMSARLGAVLKGSPCDELASRIGRPFAAAVGVTIFLIAACFQFGNNIGVLTAMEPLWPEFVSSNAAEENASPWRGILTPANALLALLNVAIIGFLFSFRRLYKPVETMMKILVGLMILAFVGNFLYLLIAGAKGGEPASPSAATQGGELLAVIGLIGTTFSVAGAFYQAYLVREKGWGIKQVKEGLIDSVAGIGILAAITLVIMSTSAIALHGRGLELKTAADVARQLEPLFGSAAVILFCAGIFAAAFSSFLVNAMIGGSMLADGLGLSGSMNSIRTKLLTTVALLIGLVVAVFVPQENRVQLIVFPQAMVVIGFPLLAFSMLYLSTQPDLTGERRIPLWMKAFACTGLLVVLISAGSLLWTLTNK